MFVEINAVNENCGNDGYKGEILQMVSIAMAQYSFFDSKVIYSLT